jgi:uncharacterized protein with PIN domain
LTCIGASPVGLVEQGLRGGDHKFQHLAASTSGGQVSRGIVVRDFFDPSPEAQVIVLMDEATLRKAELFIESCEHCNREGAEIPFDNILDRITGSDPSVTDYILEVPAKCPNCRREIFEKTLVEASCQ